MVRPHANARPTDTQSTANCCASSMPKECHGVPRQSRQPHSAEIVDQASAVGLNSWREARCHQGAARVIDDTDLDATPVLVVGCNCARCGPNGRGSDCATSALG